MSVERTKKVIDGYLSAEHVADYLTEDVVFTVMGTGQENVGHVGVGQMFEYFYRTAFDATHETRSIVYGDGKAVWEADFIGKHIGEFAGIPATGKDVRVPLCVVYELKGDKIKKARVYMEMPIMLQQLGVTS
jgi:predicted ester cyclase